MKTRLIGAAVALLLAVAGTVIVATYVSGAESRAYAGTKTRQVLVVTRPVPEGTKAGDLTSKVRLEALPAKAVATDSVTALDQLGRTVATTDLVPGEQLLSGRFAAKETLTAEGTTAVPAGMQQLTVALEPERVVGGVLKPGDTVGVYISAESPPAPSDRTTHALHAVLVTDVQGGPPSESEDSADSTDAAAASSSQSTTQLVTLAVKAADAEDIVWGKEFGRLWLTLEPKDATDAGTRVTTTKEVFR